MILFGFQHCGKTYFGRRLARYLKRPFLDTDRLITQKVGYSYKRVWQESTSKFRALEKEVIRELPQGSIISLGGGAILQPENYRYLSAFPLLYLRLSKEALRKRYADQEAFEALYAQRLPLYEAIEAAVLTLDNKSNEEILWEAIHLAHSFA